MAKVFIAATRRDLREHISAVCESIAQLSHQAVGMETFGAQTLRTLDVCRAEVRSADVLIAVLGMRYGEIASGTGKSFTHHEIEEAVSLKIPLLTFIMDEESHLIYPKDMEVGEAATALRDLKGHLSQIRLPARFSSAEGLKTQALESIKRVIPDQAAAKQLYLSRSRRIFELFQASPKEYDNIEIGLETEIGETHELNEIESGMLLYPPAMKAGRFFSKIDRDYCVVFACGDVFSQIEKIKENKRCMFDCRTKYLSDGNRQVKGLEVLRIS
jgi:hypothetical protein